MQTKEMASKRGFVHLTQETRFGLVWVSKTDNLTLFRGCYAVWTDPFGVKTVMGTVVVQDNDVHDKRWLVHIRPGYCHCEHDAHKKAKTVKEL